MGQHFVLLIMGILKMLRHYKLEGAWNISSPWVARRTTSAILQVNKIMHKLKGLFFAKNSNMKRTVFAFPH
jgi:hypothetical protein